MMLRAFAIIVALACFTPAMADTVIDYAKEDAQMNAAIAEAQASLPLFLAAGLDAQGQSKDGYMIKVGLPMVNNPSGLEHIWIGPFGRDAAGAFTGTLANEPEDLGDLRAGDTVGFAQGQITDWTVLTPEGPAWGQYTSRVMFEGGAFGDTPFDDLFQPQPVPADWE